MSEGGQALEQALQGSGHSPKLPELKKHLDKALCHMVCLLSGPTQTQELDSMILTDPIQLRLFRDSMIQFLAIFQSGKTHSEVYFVDLVFI